MYSRMSKMFINVMITLVTAKRSMSLDNEIFILRHCLYFPSSPNAQNICFKVDYRHAARQVLLMFPPHTNTASPGP